MENASEELKAQVDCEAANRRNQIILMLMWTSMFLQQLYFGLFADKCGMRSVTAIFAGYTLAAAIKQYSDIWADDSHKSKRN